MMTVGETMGGVTPELKRKADLLVLENFDYGLLGEGLLPILHHACAVLLQPDGNCPPCSRHTCTQRMTIKPHSISLDDARKSAD